MTKITLYIGLFIITISPNLFGQQMNRPSEVEIATLPLWAQKMYSTNPNVFEVDGLYMDYYRINTFVKSYHTQYYKRWRRQIENSIDQNGYVQLPSAVDISQSEENYLNLQHPTKSTGWSSVGPYHTSGTNGGSSRTQTNVYSIDQCSAQATILYLGTEPGEVFKSTDTGDSWVCVSTQINIGSGIAAVEVHPTNGNIVFAAGSNGVFKSTDGGSTWVNVLPITNLGVNEILINPGDDQIVLIAADGGLYRSINGGTNFTQILSEKSYDVKVNTAFNNVVYLLKNNPGLDRCEFFVSSDMGASWTIQSNGWYSSTDPARNDGGGRLAVSPADPNRVYAYLIGEAKANDYGFIGVYRSDDSGNSWTLPNGPDGGPYTSSHLNLAYGNPGWTYHQGFYNCAIAVSDTDPDKLLIGGLNIYQSNDGGLTFSPVAGYVGGPFSMHVDMQDFRVINGTTWVTTDGGIYKSTDFMNTQPVFKMDGVRGSDFWGFGSGWNEDVLVGGLYHNGNLAYHENYGNGNFLALGGGEAPTGYVNPGNNRRTYFSDIGGKILPIQVADPLGNFYASKYPNESYYSAESSEMEFHPNCYSQAYLGNENKLWKTTDGGTSYNLVKEFGTSVNDIVTYIEISSADPNVMYVSQRPLSGSTGILWKTIDGGLTWNSLTLPSGNSRRTLLAINPVNSNELYIAFPSGANGSKTFKTLNGGTSWTNITTSVLNSESIQSIAYIAGTNGGLYAASSRAVFYRNNTNSWVLDNSGLPLYTSGNILKPFYRDGKIRLASYGKGIWEGVLNEQPALPICRITVDKLEQVVFCLVDSFYFEDYSFLNHTNATWSWEFPTGSPSTSSLRNPAVTFANSGNHLAILTITDQNGNTDQDSLYVNVSDLTAPTFIDEDFQNEFLPTGWYFTNEDGDGQWSLNSSIGGYGNSTQSTIYDNYNIDSQGSTDDLNIPLTTVGMSEIALTFDVAYAPYGGQYSDTLEVLVSTDCGLSFQSLYLKGGATLGTAAQSSDYFEPTSSQWRTETIDLSSFVNENKVIIAFRNHGHWGNAIYVDNINIQTDLAIEETKENKIVMYPNPVSSGCIITIEGITNQNTVSIFNMEGKLLLRKWNVQSGQIQLPDNLSPGMYQVNIKTADRIINKPLIIK